MAAGRPPKFKTEREFCDLLEINLESFCLAALDCELISYKRESFMKPRTFGASKPRVDFELETTRGLHLIECKNPTQIFSEVSRGISQLLTYSVLAEPRDTTLVLVTTRTLPIIQQTILKFELPIKVVLLNDVLATWDANFEGKLKSGVIQVKDQYAIPQ